MFRVADSFSLLYSKTTWPESSSNPLCCNSVSILALRLEKTISCTTPLHSGSKKWAQRLSSSAPVLLTVKAAPTVLVVDVLCEAVFLEQLMGRMLELGQ